MENGNLRIKNDKIFKSYFTSLNVKHFLLSVSIFFARQSLSQKRISTSIRAMKIEICERKIMKKSIESGFSPTSKIKNANWL